MPKGSNQKLKLSYLCKTMQEKTDDETMKQYCTTWGIILSSIYAYNLSYMHRLFFMIQQEQVQEP